MTTETRVHSAAEALAETGRPHGAMTTPDDALDVTAARLRALADLHAAAVRPPGYPPSGPVSGEDAAAEALAERLYDAGLRAETAGRAAAVLLADPDRGHGGWAGPVDLGPGVVLWVTLPAGTTT
jgi:hypothetical protein